MIKTSVIRRAGFLVVLPLLAIAFSANRASSADKGANSMFNASTGIQATLNQFKAENKPVELHLRNGKSFKGYVAETGDHFVVLSKLAGRDFFSALIRVDSIDAVEAQTNK